MIYRSWMFITLLFLGAIAVGQEKPSAPKDTTKVEDVPFYEMGEVVVTATRSARPILRVPMAIDVVGIEDLRRSKASVYLHEVLRSIPGLSIDNRYNYTFGEKLMIRGMGARTRFGVRGMKIFLDGVPLTLPDGSAAIRDINLDMLSRVEVIRGPASSLYGNASMGVLNLFSMMEHNTPISVQTKLIMGSFGLRKWDGAILGSSGDFGYTLNINRMQVDGYRQNSAAQIMKAGFLGTYQLSPRTQLLTSLNYFDAPYMLTPGSLNRSEADITPTSAAGSYFQRGAGTRTDHWQAGLTLKYEGEDAQSVDATTHYMDKHQFNAGAADMGTRDFSIGGLRFVYRRGLTIGAMPSRLSVGSDIELYAEEREQFTNSGLPPGTAGTYSPGKIFDAIRRGPLGESEEINLTGVGPFGELEVELSPVWVLVGGARYDYFRLKSKDRHLGDGKDNSGSKVMSHFSPSLGLLYRADRYVSIYANASTAFQIPTTSELRNTRSGDDGVNSELKPEKLLNLEVGVKGVMPSERFSYDVSVFYADYTDILISYQSATTFFTYYRNAGRAANTGAEGRLQWEPVEGLRGSLTYTTLHFVFKDFVLEQTTSGVLNTYQLSGKRVPSIAPNRLNANVSYRHSVGLFAETNLEWVDEYSANDFNGPAPGVNKPASDYLNRAFTIVDARAGFVQTIAAIEVEAFVGVNNALNKRYSGSVVPNGPGDRFFEPSPGRTWYAGLRLFFKTAQ